MASRRSTPSGHVATTTTTQKWGSLFKWPKGPFSACHSQHGLVANVCATHATGTAEREAAALLLEASAPPGSTVGADKGYDVASFVADVRVRNVTPHVAQKVRWSAIDGRPTRHAGYHVSQRKRKLVEQVFGWMKTIGGLRKLRPRGVPLVEWQLTFAATAYNLVRLRNLEATCP